MARPKPIKTILDQEFRPSNEYRETILQRYEAINACRDFSQKKLHQLRREIANLVKQHSTEAKNVECVAICGSLARLEASPKSDADVITVSKAGRDAKKFHQIILQRIRELGLDSPNSKGVFAEPADIASLTKVAGGESESYRSLSQRVLFVLESKWLWNKPAYNELLDKIIDLYADDVSADPKKNFVFLLNDSMRYFRTICVNYQYSKEVTEWGKWPIRNIKLRHSRVIMYFSLLVCLGRLSAFGQTDKVARLKELVRKPPLERIFEVYAEERDQSGFRVFGSYDIFLRSMKDDETRRLLVNLEYRERYQSEPFSVLKTNSDALSAELTRFVLDRRKSWSERFFEYLII